MRSGRRTTAMAKMRSRLRSGFDVEMMPERRQRARAAGVPEELWPERDDESFERGRALLDTFELDPAEFAPRPAPSRAPRLRGDPRGRRFTADDLCHFAHEIFVRIGAHEEAFRIGGEKLKMFVLAVRGKMHRNPYHNWFHAFDVTHTAYVLALRTGVLAALEPLERFAFVAAVPRPNPPPPSY